MKKTLLALSILLLSGGALYAGLSLGRPAAFKKRISKLDDKVRAAAAPQANRAPAASLTAVSTTVVTGGPAALSMSASDADGDTLTYLWTSTAGVITGSGASVTWVVPSTPGVYAIDCTVSDGRGGTAARTLSVTSVFPGNGRWTFSTGGAIAAAPAVAADGTVYAGSADGKLYAVNPDGTQKWVFNAASPINSSPALGADGAVYFGADDGKLHALTAAGAEKTGWPFAAAGAIKSSPAIDPDGVIYVGSDDLSVYAVNPDGTQKWNYSVGSNIRTSPVLTSTAVYFGADDGFLYALNIVEGTEKDAPLPESLSPFNSSPALGSDDNLYFGGDDGFVYSVSTVSWTENWSVQQTASALTSSPALDASGTVYIGSTDGNLYAINNDATGTLKWAFAAGGAVRSSPALGAGNVLYFGADDGKIYAVDTAANPSAGVQRWAYALTPSSAVQSPLNIGPDGTVYFGTADGRLCAVFGDAALASGQWPKFHRDAANTGR